MMRNFFRKPYGPGWALVGDAAYHKDSITAQGITDAFLEAEHCAAALDEVFAGARPFDEAMANISASATNACCRCTTSPASSRAGAAAARDAGAARRHPGQQQAMDAFVRMNAGTISPAEFFAAENIGALMAAAA